MINRKPRNFAKMWMVLVCDICQGKITFIILVLQLEKKDEIREELKESQEKLGKLRLILVA